MRSADFVAPIRILAAASSIRSIALSGKKRSVTYRSDSSTAPSIASCVIVRLWCSSYSPRMPSNISFDSSIVGSSTMTGWNRRSSAASFSTYLRYSDSVVAPMIWRSPLAIAGFRMFAASNDPSAPPAPISVWISSMNSRTSPAEMISLMTFLIRSSNSPRYLLPATMPDRSSDRTRLPATISGTPPA